MIHYEDMMTTQPLPEGQEAFWITWSVQHRLLDNYTLKVSNNFSIGDCHCLLLAESFDDAAVFWKKYFIPTFSEDNKLVNFGITRCPNHLRFYRPAIYHSDMTRAKLDAEWRAQYITKSILQNLTN